MVKAVRSAEYPMDVVVKEFEMARKTRQQRKRIDEQFTREVRLHNKINQIKHPNIVRLIGYGACDIKPENIMLGHNNTPKVIDFGCSIEVRGNAAMMRGCSPDYAGPEWQWRRGMVGLPLDVHCLGMVMLELMTGRMAVEPEVDLHLRALVKETPEEALADNDYQVLWAEVHHLIADGMPRHKFVAMMNLIMQCCRNEAEDRPNIDVVVQRLEAILNPW
ncbi:hypothetical protein Tsubulata_034063 [Turnera subulata]|uniref:Protein kinase domain-containing protein n=1 Tax=Turnera subulata TaxID=218843 RepID=A0A9Q0FFY4_9ROSI|nr:hypothetical protein Tsubulata_034063 [Turnera subulata]